MRITNKKTGGPEFTLWFGPLLEALRQKGGAAKPQEVVAEIARAENLNEAELTAVYEKSNKPVFENQVAWARQYLVNEGYLDSSTRGLWSLTTKGWTAKLSHDDAKQIVRKWVRILSTARKQKEKLKPEAGTGSMANPAEKEPVDAPRETGPLSLPEVLLLVTPTGFEHLVGRLLRAWNFEEIEITKRSRDGGIDGFAILPLNQFFTQRVCFQCKRYQGSVPVKEVMSFLGVIANNPKVEKGLMITTGRFSKDAWELARNNIKLELIDGQKLVEMFEQAELGVKRQVVYEPDLAFFEPYLNDNSKAR